MVYVQTYRRGEFTHTPANRLPQKKRETRERIDSHKKRKPKRANRLRQKKRKPRSDKKKESHVSEKGKEGQAGHTKTEKTKNMDKLNTDLLEEARVDAGLKHVLFLERKVLAGDGGSVQVLERWLQQRDENMEEKKNWTKAFYSLYHAIRTYVDYVNAGNTDKLKSQGGGLVLKAPAFGTSGGKVVTSNWREGLALMRVGKKGILAMGVPREKSAEVHRLLPTAQKMLHQCDCYRRHQNPNLYPAEAKITIKMVVRMALMMSYIAEDADAATVEGMDHAYGIYGSYVVEFCAEKILSGSW